MLGTVTLAGLFVLGFLHWSLWWIAPLAVVNTFIGMYTPPHRMQRVREMGGNYWAFFIQTLPLQGLLAALIFGFGFSVGMIFG